MKHILITGASGLCGAELLRQLRDSARYHVHSTSRRVVDDDRHHQHDLAHPVPPGLFPEEIHAVIHCAAFVDENDTSHRVVHANVMTTRNIARYAVAAGAEVFVNCSSIAVYGNPERTGLIDESQACDTVTPYGLSKRMGELLCEATFEGRIRHVDLRLGYVLAVPMPERAFVVRFARMMEAGQPVRLVNPDRTRFNFVGAADLPDIVTRVIESSVAGPLNVVGDAYPTPREVYDTVKRHFPSYARTPEIHEDAATVRAVRFANDRLKRMLGIDRLQNYGDCLDAAFSAMNLGER